MFDLSDYKKYCFHDGTVTDSTVWGIGNGSSCNYGLWGEFPEDETERNGCAYFYFDFKHVRPEPPRIEDAEIRDIEIDAESHESGGYHVKICAVSFGWPPAAFFLAEFTCDDIRFGRQKYKGMSHRNVYGTAEYDAFWKSLGYLLEETYFTGKKQLDLPENYCLETDTYTDTQRRGFLQRHTLKRDGAVVYTYLCCDHHVRPFNEFIYHKNGHRYYPFHIDLYGISYLDLDTLEVYNYIPEGYQHDCEILLGESFIITDIHYDRESGLIAYGGCYWAGPPNVMVGNFSCVQDCGFPFVDMQNWLDPHYDQYDEFDFADWTEEKLLLKCGNVFASVEIDRLKERLSQPSLIGLTV